jgi:DNA-binding ferritin-like protein
MLPLIVHLRTMQLFNHSAHNLCARVPFFADHDAFAGFYSEAESAYDSVVERLIGKVGPQSLNLAQIIQSVAQKCQGLPSTEVTENAKFFEISLKLELEMCSIIEGYIKQGMIAPGVVITEGTRQMLGDLCDKSEVRQYKIKQRIKK